MSKRHNASRRRSYGRRQHELHERLDRRHDRRGDRTWRLAAGFAVSAVQDDPGATDIADGDSD